MSTKMLINATRGGQLRVAVVDGTILQEYQVEIAEDGQTRGNIYRGVVANIQPSLNAAFVDLGEERHGFLPVGDVLPCAYHKQPGKDVRRPKVDQVLEKGRPILVQVTKDGVGQKGPALSTNLALAGRYLVLTPFDGVRGISRKAEDDAARKKIRERLKKLELPENHGVIVRTNGLDQNQQTLNRDLNALLRLWKKVRDEANRGKGAKLVYSDQDLVMQALRDYLDPAIREVVVDDDVVFAKAEAFMKAFMPRSKTQLVRYEDRLPLFSRYRLETQIDRIYDRSASLPSGGGIVIDQTEALTAIDVNSGRATKTSNHDESIFKVNCEAAREVARQLRLRDIGGLVVVDFIDMRLRKHQNRLERVMRDAMKVDNARHSVGRISPNGLLEINRQRIKQSLRLRTHRACPTCTGAGTTPTPEFAALRLLSRIEARAASGLVQSVTVALPTEIADALQNGFRRHLSAIEEDHSVAIEILAASNLGLTEERIEWVQREGGAPEPSRAKSKAKASTPVFAADLTPPDRRRQETAEEEEAAEETKTGGRRRRRRRRRRSRGGSDDGARETEAAAQTATASGEDIEPKEVEPAGDEDAEKPRRTRRRRRGRRRRRSVAETPREAREAGDAAAEGEDTAGDQPERAEDSGDGDIAPSESGFVAEMDATPPPFPAPPVEETAFGEAVPAEAGDLAAAGPDDESALPAETVEVDEAAPEMAAESRAAAEEQEAKTPKKVRRRRPSRRRAASGGDEDVEATEEAGEVAEAETEEAPARRRRSRSSGRRRKVAVAEVEVDGEDGGELAAEEPTVEESAPEESVPEESAAEEPAAEEPKAPTRRRQRTSRRRAATAEEGSEEASAAEPAESAAEEEAPKEAAQEVKAPTRRRRRTTSRRRTAAAEDGTAVEAAEEKAAEAVTENAPEEAEETEAPARRRRSRSSGRRRAAAEGDEAVEPSPETEEEPARRSRSRSTSRRRTPRRAAEEAAPDEAAGAAETLSDFDVRQPESNESALHKAEPVTPHLDSLPPLPEVAPPATERPVSQRLRWQWWGGGDGEAEQAPAAGVDDVTSNDE